MHPFTLSPFPNAPKWVNKITTKELIIQDFSGALRALSNIYKSIRRKVFCKKDVAKTFANVTGKHLCWSLFLMKLQSGRTPAQEFSCELCEIFKNTVFIDTLTASTSMKERFTKMAEAYSKSCRASFVNFFFCENS